MGYVELVFRREGRFLRWCARKRLHEQFRNDPAFRSMFMDEARLAGLVHHPNAVGVLDVGEDDDGPFLLMDFVEGVSLSRLIADAVGAGREIPMQVAVRICLDAAQGLHAAHEVRAEDGTVLNLVHRDVSPQNILIGFDGTVRVTDFGIAKALGNASRTSAGVLKGNMGYVAPEQLRFEEPDRRSDFFSLGVTLYELLSGRRLYPNRVGFDGTRRILTEPPPDIGEVRSDVPPELCELLFEMLAKERDSRPATAVDIASRLEGILAVLIAEEGSVTVGDYMTQHFSEQHAEQREILSAHLKKIESQATSPTLRSIPVVVTPKSVAPAVVAKPHGKTAPRLLGALAAVALLGIGAVIGLRGRMSAEQDARPAAPNGAATTLSTGAAGDNSGSAQGTPVLPGSTLPTAIVPPPAAPVATGTKRARAGTRIVMGARERRKPVKRSAQRGRSGDTARSNPETGKAAGDPKQLSVPLFDRWQ
jgi:serine/threonine protein kinase